MPTHHSLPIDLHTGDCLAKARALRDRASRTRLLPLVIAIVLVVVLAALLPRDADSAAYAEHAGATLVVPTGD
ncbi:hypothetical protein KDM41_04905 [bacterium]|nr:hypothetical protein [bacterium]